MCSSLSCLHLVTAFEKAIGSSAASAVRSQRAAASQVVQPPGSRTAVVERWLESSRSGQAVPPSLAFTTGMTLSARYWIRSEPDSIDSPGYCAQ